MFIIFLILLWVIGLSGIAGYFSIIGFSEFFAGSPMAAMVMAGILESSKLIIVTILHRYWQLMGWLIRVILIVPLVVLIMITMSGIFGYLSKSHLTQTTPISQLTTQQENLDNQIKLNKTQTQRFQEQLTTMDSIVQSQIAVVILLEQTQPEKVRKKKEMLLRQA